jgi:1,4-alpha-glucan branching enzyme
VGANDLSALLWRERELLDLLIFKLEEEQLLLTSGKTRWLHHATREVEQTLERVRSAGLAREVEAVAVATEWAADPDSGLRGLVSAAPATWQEILGAHATAMTKQAARIKELRDANEQFLRAAARSTQETLANLQPGAVTYDARGAAGTAAAPGASLFDKQL